MMLTNLADICRKAGMKTVEVSGWKTRGHGPMHPPETVVCHHTAGPRTGNMPSLRILVEGRSDLPGPLCHLGLARDGTVYVVAAGLAYHAGVVRQTTMGNAYSIGIEAEATGVDSWPELQMKAYAQLGRALCDAYGIPIARVLGHKEVCSPAGRKSDPNFDMSAFRRRVSTYQEDGMAAITEWSPEERHEFQRLVRATDIDINRDGKLVPVNLGAVIRELEETQDQMSAKLDRIIKKIGA